jgi:hypothetical protein
MRPGRFVPEPSTLMNALSRVVVLAGTVGWLWITIAVIQIML